MLCLACNKKFYIKRTFLTLFDTKTRFICDKCYNENPIIPKVDMITLDDGEIIIVSLFNTIYRVNMKPYAYEINQVFNHFYREYKGYYIILLDYISLTIFNLEILSFWSTVFDKKVLIICGVLRK